MRDQEDIVDVLLAAAEMPAELTSDETAQLLSDAAQVIVTLRALLDIREQGGASSW